MLQGTLNSEYRNKSGNRIYTYIVSGTPSELAAYRLAKGEYNVDTELGQPLFFLPAKDIDGADRIIEPIIKLTITTNKRVVIDGLAAEQALMRDTRGHMAEKWAEALVAKKMGGATVRPTPVVPVKVDKLTDPENLIDTLVPTEVEGNENIDGSKA